jgi:hypothetical protein
MVHGQNFVEAACVHPTQVHQVFMVDIVDGTSFLGVQYVHHLTVSTNPSEFHTLPLSTTKTYLNAY